MVALTTAEQWEALELTRQALSQEDNSTPLPTYLVDVLLPRAGISIEYVSFQACALIPNTRTCTVHYLIGQRSDIERIRDLRKEGKLEELRIFTLKFQKSMGTLEAVVWNAVLYNNEAVVPLDLNLCACRDMEQFRQYVYIALGYSTSTFVLNNFSRHVDKIGPVETLHRSWMEHNFARWDTSSDLTSRYAALRALVAFPSEVEHDIVVTMREIRPQEKPEKKALYDRITPIMKKEFEAAYKANYATTDSVKTWGLGAIAFFGACRGDRWVWSKALAEANRWFNRHSPLVSVSCDDAHFPEAVYALSRAAFRGNVLALAAFRKRIEHSKKEVVSVKIEFQDAQAPNKNYVTKIGSSEHFFEALAHSFWIDEDFDDIDNKPVVSKVVVGLVGEEDLIVNSDSLRFEGDENSTLKLRHTFDAVANYSTSLYGDRDELWEQISDNDDDNRIAAVVKDHAANALAPRDPVAIIAACGDGTWPMGDDDDVEEERNVSTMARNMYLQGGYTYPRLGEDADMIMYRVGASSDLFEIAYKVNGVVNVMTYFVRAAFNVMTTRVIKMTLDGFERTGLCRAWEHASALDRDIGTDDVPYQRLMYMSLPSSLRGEFEAELKIIVEHVASSKSVAMSDEETSVLAKTFANVATNVLRFDAVERCMGLIDMQLPLLPHNEKDLTVPSPTLAIYLDKIEEKKADAKRKANEALAAKITSLENEMKALKERQDALAKTYNDARNAVTSADEALKASLKAVQDLVAKIQQEKATAAAAEKATALSSQ